MPQSHALLFRRGGCLHISSATIAQVGTQDIQTIDSLSPQQPE